MGYMRRLDKAFEKAPTLSLGPCSRYVFFSDCHRGQGNSNDNFLKNQHLYLAALQHYFQQGYTYVELGDGDELWENRNLKQIIEVHSDVFHILGQFYRQRRLYLLYGNHDMAKKNARYTAKTCSSYFCIEKQTETSLFPGLSVQEGFILRDQDHNPILYLTHGHQADIWNSTLWRFTRTMVRYLWGPLERMGFSDPTSAAKNHKVKKKTETRLTFWARRHHCLLMCGHTHRPVMATLKSPYFNSGSCVHPLCITCIELTCGQFTLVKWTMTSRKDGSLYVAREELIEPVSLEVFAPFLTFSRILVE